MGTADLGYCARLIQPPFLYKQRVFPQIIMTQIVPVFIKCECGNFFSPDAYYEICDDCVMQEFEDYIEGVQARRALARQFREVTPPPDRRRMTARRKYDNPLR